MPRPTGVAGLEMGVRGENAAEGPSRTFWTLWQSHAPPTIPPTTRSDYRRLPPKALDGNRNKKDKTRESGGRCGVMTGMRQIKGFSISHGAGAHTPAPARAHLSHNKSRQGRFFFN